MAYARDTAATDICRYPGHMPRISVGVQVKIFLVYHRKDKEFKGVEKAAEILARYQKPKELEVPQLSEKENVVYEREMYRSCAWVAQATPAKAPTSQDLTGIPSPFDSAMFDGRSRFGPPWPSWGHLGCVSMCRQAAIG